MAVNYTWEKYKANSTTEYIEGREEKVSEVKVYYPFKVAKSYRFYSGSGFSLDEPRTIASANDYIHEQGMYSDGYYDYYLMEDRDPYTLYHVLGYVPSGLGVYMADSYSHFENEGSGTFKKWSSSVETTYSKGSYVGTVTSTTSNAYPNNGRHSDGYWYVYVGNDNVAPTTPGTPSLPTEINGGESITSSWSVASDANDNLSGYALEVSLDGGAWTQVYTGSFNSYNYTIPPSTETIAFRVRAYDSLSAYSGYATSSVHAVINIIKSMYGYATIDSINKDLTGEGYACIEGVWKPLMYSFSCIGSVWTGFETVLPAGYTQVEYIETTGTQYIDTGFKPNQNTRVVMDFQANNNACHLFGARTAFQNKGFLVCWNTNFNYCVQVANSCYNGGSFDEKVRHTADMTASTFILDGTTKATYSVSAFQTVYNLYLASCPNSNTSENMIGKIYSCQVYDNGTLIRDYIPCINASGEIGMYDVVNNAFYRNAGSGAFTAGSKV